MMKIKFNSPHLFSFTVSLAFTLLLTACAGNHRTPAQQLRGSEGYGIALRAEPIEYYRSNCNPRLFECDIFMADLSDKQILEVAVAAQNGKLLLYKVVSRIADVSHAGDVIRFRFPNDQYLSGHAIEVPVKSNHCGWKNGSIETKQGGVECNGWSYRSMPQFSSN